MTNATSYNIYWGTTAGITKLNGAKITDVTSPYVHTSLTNGTTYHYVVTAINAGGESAESSEVTAAAQVVAPGAPTVVAATSGNNEATIAWSDVTGATSYNIYWRTATGVSKLNGTKITGATSPYVHTSLTNGTTYYYAVTSVNAGGESAESAEVGATPSVPPPVTISNLRDKGVVQTGFVIGTASYTGLTEVQVSSDGGTTWAPATGTTSWKFMLPTGTNTWKDGSQHTIQVRATDGTTFSAPVIITVHKGINKDVNGDGYVDLAVGAPAAMVGGVYNSGAAYVFHGSITGVTSAATAANSTLTGTVGSYFGTAVALGDVNGDGYADLVVGATGTNTTLNGQSYTGAVHVFDGSSTGINSVASSAAASTIVGPGSVSFFGLSVALGDANGDGYADISVGMIDTAFVFHGSAAGVASGVVAATASAAATLYGISNSDFGGSLAFGDVNGDSYADLVVGSNHAYGDVYVFSGSATGVASALTSAAATTLTRPYGSSFFGISVALGDVNGDGYADIAVGADLAAYVFHGSASGVPSVAATSASSILTGNSRNFGRSVAMGDVNGDGYADLVVGAHAASYYGIEGMAYVFNGSSSGVASAASNNAASTLTGPANGYFGYSLSLGDVNGDGYADLAVGASGAGSSGAAYLFHGSSTGAPNAAYTGADTTLTGTDSASLFGRSIAK